MEQKLGYSKYILKNILRMRKLRNEANDIEMMIYEELEDYKQEEPIEAKMLLEELRRA